MSRKYKSSRDVPTTALADRLEALSDVIAGQGENWANEFRMSVPAGCDRDADLVMGEAARRLRDNGWISVTEGLPEENGRYLVYLRNYNFLNGSPWASVEQFFDGEWGGGHATVTHWQQLPAPPPEGK